MQLISITLFFSVLFASSLSVSVSVLRRHDVPNKAIFERANPQIGEKTLVKRAEPTIGAGIDVNDPRQGLKLFPHVPVAGGFFIALSILKSAIAAIDTPIYAKYFDIKDRDVVLKVLERLFGDDGSEFVVGAAELANIVVKAGTDDPNDPAPASLENYNDPNPSLIMGDNAWNFPTRDDNPEPCTPWENGMSQNMYLLGSVLLNEYLQWDWFLADIHGGHIINQPNGYGWKAARALPKNLAIFNADSYTWFATEASWGGTCGKFFDGFDAPSEDDE